MQDKAEENCLITNSLSVEPQLTTHVNHSR